MMLARSLPRAENAGGASAPSGAGRAAALGEGDEIEGAQIGEGLARPGAALGVDGRVPERDARAGGADDVGELRALQGRVDGDGHGAGAEDAEVGDGPGRVVLARDHHAVAGAHAERREAGGGGAGGGAELQVGEPAPPVAGEPHQRGRVLVALGHLVEHVEERLVGPERLQLLLHLLLDERVDPLLEARQVHLPHPLPPVDLLGLPEEAGPLLGRHAVHRGARVGAGEDPVGLGHEGHEDLEDLGRPVLGLGGAGERLGGGLQQRAQRAVAHAVEDGARGPAGRRRSAGSRGSRTASW